MKICKMTLFYVVLLIISCEKQESMIQLVDAKNFESNVDGKAVRLVTLSNDNGTVAQITNYGGRVVSLWVRDRAGNFDDIVLGYETLEGYLNSNEQYFGAIIGRFGNRIAKGQFSIGDSTYSLATNNGENHLHGGPKGFHNVVWNMVHESDSSLVLSYRSQDGEEGYPGNLEVEITYSLTNNDELKIKYLTTTDKPTPINLTHHSFFNLAGVGKATINDHDLQINASYYTPVVEGLIPTGEVRSVKNTPFDFTTPKRIGLDLEANDMQMKYGFGYDHNFVVDGAGLRVAAVAKDPISGRVMEVITTEPGLQFYGGNFLNGEDVGKRNVSYEYRTAFCLEAQRFPDSPNQPSFPSTILNPGHNYESLCIYKFSTN